MTFTPDKDDQINPRITVGEFEANMEGDDYAGAYPDRDYWECDLCSTGVPYAKEARATMYFADDVLDTDAHKIHSQRPLVALATTCPDCGTKRLLYPCEGFAEIHVQVTITEDRRLIDAEVTDLSPRDDGIPWDPKEVSEAITGKPFEDNAMMASAAPGMEGVRWGPEDMVRFFLSIGGELDIRELVRYDGSLDPKALGRARRAYEDFMEKMRKGDYDRKKFRDHVRGEDGP